MAVLCGDARWWLLSAAVGYARVYFHCHYVLDTVAGAAIGLAVSTLLDRAAYPGGWALFAWWHVPAGAVIYVGFMLLVSGSADPTNVRREEIVG